MPISEQNDVIILGSEEPAFKCLKRCTSFKYQLHHEEISDKDEAMHENDLYFFFLSKEVEGWHEFESYSTFQLFSDIGGIMGLLLGISLLTIVELFMKSVSWLLTYLTTN